MEVVKKLIVDFKIHIKKKTDKNVLKQKILNISILQLSFFNCELLTK